MEIYRVAVLSVRELVPPNNIGRDPAIEYFKGIEKTLNKEVTIIELNDSIAAFEKFNVKMKVVDLNDNEISLSSDSEKKVKLWFNENLIEFRIFPHKLFEKIADILGFLSAKEKEYKKLVKAKKEKMDFKSYLEQEIKQKFDESEVADYFFHYVAPFIEYNGVVYFIPRATVISDIGGVIDLVKVIKVSPIKAKRFIKSKRIRVATGILYMTNEISEKADIFSSIRDYEKEIVNLEKTLIKKHSGVFISIKHIFDDSKNTIWLGVHPFIINNNIMYGGITILTRLISNIEDKLKKEYVKKFIW
ncbi:MAG: hypothetical protein ABGF52_12690 [Candidatus Asgardarchaeum sp.]